MWCLNGTKRKNFCERHIHPHNVWGRSRVDTVLFIKLYIVDALCIKFNMCLNQQYSIWMHQSLSKAEGRTVKVNDCTGRYTKQAEGPGLTHTHTHTRARMHAVTHTLRLCGGVNPGWWQGHYSLVSPTRARFGLDSVAARPSMAGQRWGERDQDPSLLLWLGAWSLSFSLCLCLHQINGPGPTEEVFQSVPPAKIVHHLDSLLFIMALIHRCTYTHTCTDVYLVAFFCGWLWRKASPQVAILSGYKLSNRALFSPSSGRLSFPCVTALSAQLLSWILNDLFRMKWVKHNWLSVSGTSVPKLGLELRIQGEARRDLSPSRASPQAAKAQRGSPHAPWPVVSLLLGPFVLRNI